MGGSTNTHRFEVLLDFYFDRQWAEKHEPAFQSVVKKISDRANSEHAAWKETQRAMSAEIEAATAHLEALKKLWWTVEIADLRKDLIDVVLPPDALLAWIHEWKQQLKTWYTECPLSSEVYPADPIFGARPNYIHDSDRILSALKAFRTSVVQERRKSLDDFSRLSKVQGIFSTVLWELWRVQQQLRDASSSVATIHAAPFPPDCSAQYSTLQVEHAQLQLAHADALADNARSSQEVVHSRAQIAALRVRMTALEQLLANKARTPTLCIGVERIDENATIEVALAWLTANVGIISFEQTNEIKQAVRDFLSHLIDESVTMQTSSSCERTDGNRPLGSGTTGTAVLRPVMNQLKWRIDKTQTLPELLKLLGDIPVLEIMATLSDRNSVGKVSNTVQNLSGSCYSVARQKGYFWVGKDNSLNGAILQFIDMFERETLAGDLNPKRLGAALRTNLPRMTVLVRRIRTIVNV